MASSLAGLVEFLSSGISQLVGVSPPARETDLAWHPDAYREARRRTMRDLPPEAPMDRTLFVLHSNSPNSIRALRTIRATLRELGGDVTSWRVTDGYNDDGDEDGHPQRMSVPEAAATVQLAERLVLVGTPLLRDKGDRVAGYRHSSLLLAAQQREAGLRTAIVSRAAFEDVGREVLEVLMSVARPYKWSPSDVAAALRVALARQAQAAPRWLREEASLHEALEAFGPAFAAALARELPLGDDVTVSIVLREASAEKAEGTVEAALRLCERGDTAGAATLVRVRLGDGGAGITTVEPHAHWVSDALSLVGPSITGTKGRGMAMYGEADAPRGDRVVEHIRQMVPPRAWVESPDEAAVVIVVVSHLTQSDEKIKTLLRRQILTRAKHKTAAPLLVAVLLPGLSPEELPPVMRDPTLCRLRPTRDLDDLKQYAIRVAARLPLRVRAKQVLTFRLPVRPHHFVGRKAYMRRLSELVSGDHAAVTVTSTGLAGMGKSTVVAEWVRREVLSYEYDVVAWLRAERASDAEADLAALGVSCLDMSRLRDESEAVFVRRVVDALSDESRFAVLIVFDNADAREHDALKALQPRHCRTVYTARDAGAFTDSTLLPLEPLPEAEAVELLRLVSGRETNEDEEAATLARAVDRLPLAVAQVGAFARKAGKSFGSVLRQIQEREASSAALGGRLSVFAEYDRGVTVMAAFDMAYDALGAESAAVLHRLAVVAPDRVPCGLVVLDEQCDGTALAELRNLGMVALESSAGEFANVPFLVQAHARGRMQQHEMAAALIAVARATERQLELFDRCDKGTWGLHAAAVAPHAERAFRYACEAGDVVACESLRGCMCRVAEFYMCTSREQEEETRETERCNLNKTATGWDVHVAEVMKRGPGTEAGSFYGADLGDEGCAAVARYLQREDCSVEVLGLFGQRIGDQGAKELADALKVNISIAELNLGGNQIGDEGATALADSLKVNRSIKAIWLEKNLICDDGTEALATALEVNQSIEVIYLGGNGIGDRGAKALADSVQVRSQLAPRTTHVPSNHRHPSLPLRQSNPHHRLKGLYGVELWTVIGDSVPVEVARREGNMSSYAGPSNRAILAFLRSDDYAAT